VVPESSIWQLQTRLECLRYRGRRW
jgi:hypothetical protein